VVVGGYCILGYENTLRLPLLYMGYLRMLGYENTSRLPILDIVLSFLLAPALRGTMQLHNARGPTCCSKLMMEGDIRYWTLVVGKKMQIMTVFLFM